MTATVPLWVAVVTTVGSPLLACTEDDYEDDYEDQPA